MHARLILGLCALLASCGGAVDGPGATAKAGSVFEGPVQRAVCGAGSQPETDLQGRVSIEDRESGRSRAGYWCNFELLGQYQGQGTSWVSQSYRDCAYHSQTLASLASATPGVHVVDVRDPAHPVLSERLTSPAFLGNTWESLKVNEARGLLAGVQVGPIVGAAFFDIYDIATDCLHPRLLNSIAGSQLSLPADTLGHEGGWSPDGNTYWSAGGAPGLLTAIDVSNPALPKVLFVGTTSLVNHGFELSDDGNRLYMADTSPGGGIPNGLAIYDVSEIQQRKPLPQIHRVGEVHWTDGQLGQHSVVVSWDGKPHLIFVDEGLSGVARIIDISDETTPRVVSKLKLEVHMPEHAGLRTIDTANNGTPFGYDGHYCTVDRRENPTAAACGYFQSGIRVFDIRDPLQPREIAYFNPPAQSAKKAELTGSEHASSALGIQADLSTDWCSSPPRFVGDDQLWVTCQDNGFMVLKFTNGAYPIGAQPGVQDPGHVGGAFAPLNLLVLVLGTRRRRK